MNILVSSNISICYFKLNNWKHFHGLGCSKKIKCIHSTNWLSLYFASHPGFLLYLHSYRLHPSSSHTALLVCCMPPKELNAEFTLWKSALIDFTILNWMKMRARPIIYVTFKMFGLVFNIKCLTSTSDQTFNSIKRAIL